MEYSQLVPASLKAPSPNFCDLVDCFLHVNDDFRKEIFAVLAWCLWNRRNALHIGRVVQPIANISSMACNLLQEFLVAQEEDDLPGHLPPTQHQWRPPEQGYFKVNYDAAVFKTLNLAGVGVIICDWRGEVTAALSMPVPLSITIADLEALACRRAVMYTVENDLHNVIFEGDSASVINAISQESAVLTSFGNIVDDIRALVSIFQFFNLFMSIVLVMLLPTR